MDRLSDAFINRDREADVELKVRMININYEQNRVEDLKRAAFDPAYQKELFREFHL